MKKAIDLKKLQVVLNAASVQLAKEYYKLLITNIKDNAFKNANADSTIRKKGSDVPMIETGELVDNIIIDKFTVKMKEGLHSGGISYDELMSIMEYGRMDKHILPMRVWRETVKQFEPRAKEIIEAEFKRNKK